jgi:hypothetical protein
VERLGRSIPLSTTYRLLARHGWRKIQPDTKHPKSDPAVQEEFKKNIPKLMATACMNNQQKRKLWKQTELSTGIGKMNNPIDLCQLL